MATGSPDSTEVGQENGGRADGPSAGGLRVPRLHILVDAAASARLSLIEALSDRGAGALAFHFRDPTLHGRAVYDSSISLKSVIRSGATFLVNDRVDVALAVAADGVHLKESSLPPDDVRRIVGPRLLVGRSVHDLEGVARWGGRSPRPSADYVVLGSVGPTESHPGRPPLPAEVVRRAPDRNGVPLLAIGGVTPARLADVCRWGYHGAAVQRGIWDAPDPLGALSAYLQVLSRHPSPWSQDEDD